MTVGGLLSFLSAILMLYKPLKDVTQDQHRAPGRARVGAARIFEVVDAENDIAERPGARTCRPFATALRYEGVVVRLRRGAGPRGTST